MSAIRNEIAAILSVTPSAERDGFVAEFTPPADFSGFRGHFEGNPIVPGVCLISAVLLGAEKTLARRLAISQLNSAKFFSPVTPHDHVTITASIAAQEGEWLVKAHLARDARVAAISLLARPAAQED